MPRFLTGSLLLLLAAACSAERASSARTGTAAPPAEAAGSASRPAADPAHEAPAGAGAPDLHPVHFGFDSAELTAGARETLAGHADLLRQRRDVQVTIEGHTDERGTEEYNLALGDRRAGAVRRFLRLAGVDDSRLRGVSYGENRPIEPGSSEAAHDRNRRAGFVTR